MTVAATLARQAGYAGALRLDRQHLGLYGRYAARGGMRSLVSCPTVKFPGAIIQASTKAPSPASFHDFDGRLA